eukprot:COSAG01_NODE_34834_length_541_cov_1.033937_2_plen_92_part_01
MGARIRLLVSLGCLLHASSCEGGWIENTGTADNNIVSGSSGENLACPNNAWKTVDGIEDFGCVGATPGQPIVSSGRFDRWHPATLSPHARDL